MSLRDEIPTNANNLDNLEKQPKTYKTDKMIYRLTKQDVFRIKNDANIKRIECENIQIALKLYINEKEKSILATRRLTDYVNETYTAPQFDSDLINKVYYTMLSYFYNVPYSSISRLKNLNEGENLYNVMSYEEMRFISIMKNDVVNTGLKQKFTSQESLLNYVKKLAIVGREKFISKYEVDPLLVERSEYNCYEVLDFSKELDEIIKSKTNNTTETRIKQFKNENDTQINNELEEGQTR
ncbi:MAG: hypothetical protein ACI4TX_03620 [Christensenellales bacterium]